MILTISLPDAFEDKLVAHAQSSPNVAAKKLIERFIEYKPADRTLFFTDEQRKALEKVYGQPIDASNVDRFIEWIRQRALLNVGAIEVPLSAAQMKRALTNATKVGSKDGQPVSGEAVAAYMNGLVRETITVALGPA